jgi:hypothetical protein
MRCDEMMTFKGGHPQSEETREKLRIAHRGKPLNNEHRQKIAMGIRNYYDLLSAEDRESRGFSSKSKGVYWDRGCKKWAAYVWYERRKIRLGVYLDESEAVKVHDEVVNLLRFGG